MRERVLGGTPVGLLAYRGDHPVAWCSVAPKATFERLGKGVGDDIDAVWSITCFFVPRAERGQGLVGRLIDAAIDAARQHGARAVEAYPVDVDSPSYRFGGFVQTFARKQFKETGRLGTRRHIVRRGLRPPRR